MKKIFTFLMIVFVFLPYYFYGQWINCSDNNYQDSIYTPVFSDSIQFGENYTIGGKFQKLFMDIYIPEEDTSSYRPAVVLAFGGAYIRGERADVEPICKMFSSRGYVCATIDYRLFDALKFPDSTVILDEGLKARADMIAAIKYLKWDAANENRWRINPEHIFVGGASSGSITALLTTYFNEKDSTDVKDWMKPVLEDNGWYQGDSYFDYTENYDYNVSGVANMLGAIIDLDYIDKGEPLHVGIHGTEDDVVPYGEGYIKLLGIPVFKLFGSSLVHQRALEEDIHSSFISVEGGGHGDFLKDGSPWLDSMIRTTLKDFHDYVLCPEETGLDFIPAYTVRLFPNPASDYLIISSTKEFDNLNAIVYNMNGDIVLIKNISTEDNRLDIKNLPTGFYTLKLTDKNGANPGLKRFIKH